MDGDLGGDHSGSEATTPSGTKRSFGDIEGDQNDISVSKKGCTNVAEGLTIAMVLTLQESLEKCQAELASVQESSSGNLDKCKDELASCQSELESAKAEVGKWKSAFKKESFIPARKSPEPQHLIDYIETLRSSEKFLKEQLEIAQMKLAIRDLKSQLKPESVKPTDGDAEVDGEEQGSTPSGPSRVAYLEDALRAAYAEIAHLNEVAGVRLDAIEKQMELAKFVIQKFPSLLPPPSAPEGDNDEQK